MKQTHVKRRQLGQPQVEHSIHSHHRVPTRTHAELQSVLRVTKLTVGGALDMQHVLVALSIAPKDLSSGVGHC